MNIIVAYGTRDEASNPGDVGKLDAVHQSSVSRNNAFLTTLGILRGDREKLVTSQGRELALALSRKDRGAIRRSWRQLVSQDEFMQNVVSAVKLREGMPRPAVQAYVAHATRQPRNKPVMTGAGAIIDILKAAGLLREEDGQLAATFDDASEAPDAARDHDFSEPVAASIRADGTPGVPAVNIHLHVRCDVDEIEDLAPRLKALLRELSRPTP